MSLTKIAGVEVVDIFQPSPDRDVWAVLTRPLRSLGNVDLVLRLDPRWRGKIRWNEFHRRVEVYGEALTDEAVTRGRIWMERAYTIRCGADLWTEAVKAIARDNPYHPVRDYLDGLKWDGQPRMDSLLHRYFGVMEPLDEEDPHRVYGRVGRAFMISCVARVVKPGEKVDTVLVLSGSQGSYKSTGLKMLCPDPGWFSDSRLDVASKDALAQIHAGVWLYELAELEGLHKREAAQIKAFLSSHRDKFRPHYGRLPVDWGRQCVFVATTNLPAFLRDPTGSRRFWPARAGRIRIDLIAEDRDQLWAEAVTAYRAGERWYLTQEEAADLRLISEDFQSRDPWEVAIADWIDSPVSPAEFTTMDILEHLRVPMDRRLRSHENRVCAILARLRCRPGGRKRTAAGRRRVWRSWRGDD